MRRFILASLSFAFLAACGVDTTGLSAELKRTSHPGTDANATVQVVEFADLQCPACKAAHETITTPLVAKYGTKIRLDFMHFPLQALHPYALAAAQASECSADQGKFWEFLDVNYMNQKDLNTANLTKWAQSLGLDMDLFDRCLRSGIKKDAILDEYKKGQGVNVRGTPTFFVNGQQVESSAAAIGAAIDAALANPGQKL